MKSNRITGTLHEEQYTFSIIFRSVHLRMRNVSDKSCRGTQNTDFVFNNFFFENRAVYEIMWENNVYQGKYTDTNLEHALCLQAVCFLETETDIP